MKKRVVVAIIGVLVIVAIASFVFGSRPLIIWLVNSEFQKAFPHSTVSMGDLVVDCNLFSLIRGHISKVFVRDLKIIVNAPHQRFSDVIAYFGRSTGTQWPVLDSISIIHGYISITTQDARIKCGISAEMRPQDLYLDFLDIGIDTVEMGVCKVWGLAILLRQKTSGSLLLKKISYGKLLVADMAATTMLNGHSMDINGISGKLFDGEVAGSATVSIDKSGFSYEAHIKSDDLSVARIAEDMNLVEKVAMDGLIAGGIDIKGRNLNIETLRGSFLAVAPGGTFIIKDERFLASIAERTGQPIDIIRDNFKDYHYATGTVTLALEKKDLVCDVALDGEKGKRTLNVVVHDLISE